MSSLRPFTLVAWAAALALAGACAQPLPSASPTRAPELAARPSPLDGGTAASRAPGDLETPPTGPGSAVATATAAPKASPRSAASQGPSAPQASSDQDRRPSPGATGAAAARTVGETEDAPGDHGVEGPPYADLRGVSLVDLGDDLEIRVRVGGELPATLREGEVLGLGVDLLRGDDGESLYQVFVDGGSNGWRSYFQTPSGFVAFPGRFALGGSRIVVTIPWAELGHPPRGPFDAFVDWSQERLLVNAASSDRAPDDGDAAFQR